MCSYTQFRTNSETELPSGEERSIFFKKKAPPPRYSGQKTKKKNATKISRRRQRSVLCEQCRTDEKKTPTGAEHPTPPIVTTYGEPPRSNYIRGQGPKQGHQQPQEKTQQTPKRTKSKGNLPRNRVRDKKIRGAKKITAYTNVQKPVGFFRFVYRKPVWG